MKRLSCDGGLLDGRTEHFVLMFFNELWGYGPYFNLMDSEAQLAESRPESPPVVIQSVSKMGGQFEITN